MTDEKSIPGDAAETAAVGPEELPQAVRDMAEEAQRTAHQQQAAAEAGAQAMAAL